MDPYYPSFDDWHLRLHEPGQTLHDPVPLVDPDKDFAARMCIWAFEAFLVLFFGLVAWPGQPSP